MAVLDNERPAGPKKPARWSRRKITIAIAAIAVTATVIAVSLIRILMPPSDHSYTAAEVVAPMEQVVAETAASLPNFPGFSERVWSYVGCSSGGAPSEDYVGIQITYEFSKELSTEPLTRETFLDEIRTAWTDQGYEITRDVQQGDNPPYHSLDAVRDDGITMSYWVANTVSLTVQSGCVASDDVEEIPYIPPTGGIEPGSEADGVDRFFPDGIPAEDLSTEPADASASDPSDGN